MISSVRKMLESELLGRPVRKILWILFKLSLWQHQLTAKLLHLHPYIRKLEGRSPNFEDRKDWESALFRYFGILRDSLQRVPFKPTISVLVPVYQTDHKILKECLGSLAAQIYGDWEACLVDDGSSDPVIDKILEDFSNKWPGKVKIHRNEKNLRVSLTLNRALGMAAGDYVVLLDHDDRLLPNALGEVVRFINLHGQPEVLFSDTSFIDEHGDFLGTYHKPGWSPLMHLSVNYTAHLSVYRRDLLMRLGGCRQGFEGVHGHDLMLRAYEATIKPLVHIPFNLYQRRSSKRLKESPIPVPSSLAALGIKAVQEACARRGTPAAVSFEPRTQHYRVKFRLLSPKPPLISIIIPSRDAFELIKPCLDSIFEKSSYRVFEVVLIDHETTDGRCLELYKSKSDQYEAQFQVVPYKGYFNFAEMNNLGAAHAKGEYLLLLNNDTEVVSPDWLDELLAVAQLPKSGAVGGLLLYPNERIQHAGIVGLGSSIAGNAGHKERSDSLSYFGYHQTIHETLGVTGACLMVAKSKYQEAGGLEAAYVANGFGDMDFCLKLQKLGYANVYVPHAVLTHRESWTRKETFELFEKYYMLHKWPSELLTDPYRNICMQKGMHFKMDVRFGSQAPSPTWFRKLISEGVSP